MRVAFISDIHEDIVRLRECLHAVRKLKCDKIVCLGDLVGFSVPYYSYLNQRDAGAVIDLVRRHCDEVVVGNHDLYAARQLPRASDGFDYPKHWYRMSYRERKATARGKVWLYEANELTAALEPEHRRYLAGLPQFRVRTFGSLRVFITHYAYPNLSGTRTWEPRTARQFARHFRFAARHGCSVSISGHKHVQGLAVATTQGFWAARFGERFRLGPEPTWINGPAVANGTSKNGFIVLDTRSMEVQAVPLGSRPVCLQTETQK